MCKLLSMWWSGGERDDLFWRTSTSGGRATFRSKQDRKTQGQYGDVAATDPVGKPLIDFATIELKTGYNKHTLHNLIDAPGRYKQAQEWRKWIDKATLDRVRSGTLTWMIIAKRDQREPIVVIPLKPLHQIENHLRDYFNKVFVRPAVWMNLNTVTESGHQQSLVVLTLEDFMHMVSRECIVSMLEHGVFKSRKRLPRPKLKKR